MNSSHFVGWDIGGAHLKVASLDQSGKFQLVEQFATPLWKGLAELEKAFPLIIDRLPQGVASHTLTMTGELADIFTNRQAGVQRLITLCEQHLGKEIQFYSSKYGLLNTDNARKNKASIASANWHATATYTASKIDSGLLIDVGSTTTDIIPFCDNSVLNRGDNDQDRLQFDELVYTGVIRTPLMSLTQRVPFNGEWQSLATEHFSTTADIYRVLEKLQESDDLMEPVDGSSNDIKNSINRLARMLGTDPVRSDKLQKWQQLAKYFAEVQLQWLTTAILRVLSSTEDNGTIVGAGVGRFLIHEIATRLNRHYIEFSELFDSTPLQHRCNVCAPAVALAQLNRQDVNEAL